MLRFRFRKLVKTDILCFSTFTVNVSLLKVVLVACACFLNQYLLSCQILDFILYFLKNRLFAFLKDLFSFIGKSGIQRG